jgi:hypothetical protein
MPLCQAMKNAWLQFQKKYFVLSMPNADTQGSIYREVIDQLKKFPKFF